MITSITKVYEDFVRDITSRTFSVSGKKVPVVFFDKFNKTPTEIDRASYPVISIQTYMPRPSNSWRDNMKEEYDGMAGYDSNDVPSTIQLFREPVLMDFRFDVSVATKKQSELWSLCDQMLRYYGVESEMMLDKKVLPDGTEIGIPVWVKVQATDVPRDDEVKEVNHEFSFDCFIDTKDPQVLDLVKKLFIKLTQHGKD